MLFWLMNSNPIQQKTRLPAPTILDPTMLSFIQAGVVLGMMMMWWSQTGTEKTPTESDPVGQNGTGVATLDAGESESKLHYRIDLNAAGKLELQLLPGVGQITAEQILDDREARGPFESINDLARVAGVGEKTIEAIRPYCQAKADRGSDPGSTSSDNKLHAKAR